MMESTYNYISEDEQLGADFDWFATDKEGNILHLASGCGKLPDSVAQSRSDLERLWQYCTSLPTISKEVIINPHIKKYVRYIFKEELKAYTESYAAMSHKGLYSFDKTNDGLSHFDDDHYHLVTKPTIPLKLTDLPEEIRDILQKTTLEESIENIDVLHIKQIA